MSTSIPTLLRLERARYRARLCLTVAVVLWTALSESLAAHGLIGPRPGSPPADPGWRLAPTDGRNPEGARHQVPEPSLPEEAKLIASDGWSGDNFGSCVALYGKRAIVGAPGDDDRGSLSGAAYVFERQGDTWVEVGKLTASDGAAYDQLGFAVALSGDWTLAGSPYDDDLGDSSGSAIIFKRRDDGSWAEEAKLTASDAGPTDNFGRSVALSGVRALIGAYSSDGQVRETGAAYVFERQVDGSWTEVAKLTASDGRPGDHFGSAVALSGDRALVGAMWDDESPWQLDCGSAYVFERRPDGSWVEEAKLTAESFPHDEFGVSVALSDERAVVGAHWHDYPGGEYAGAAYVFERQADGKWTEQAKLSASDTAPEHFFGYSVAIHGRRALVGAYGDDDKGTRSGSAYVYERQADGGWPEVDKLTASDGTAFDEFGRSVVLSSERGLVGAYEAEGRVISTGAAYLFSPRQCELGLTLEPARLPAGEELRVEISLHHRRPVTVTVPLLLWIEDAAGREIARRTGPRVTMAPWDRIERTLAVSLPADLTPGEYRLLVGVEKMQQGVAGAVRKFRVTE